MKMRSRSSKPTFLSSDEENNSSFVATSFFQKKKNTYLTPMERKEIRDRAAGKGIILDKNLKSVGQDKSSSEEETVIKQIKKSVPPKSAPKKIKPKVKTESREVKESFEKIEGRDKYWGVKQKSPAKRSPKKSPRKSPKKGVRRSPRKLGQKGIKLYIQNWRKQQQSSKRGKASKKTIKTANKNIPKKAAVPVTKDNSSSKASRGLNFGDQLKLITQEENQFVTPPLEDLPDVDIQEDREMNSDATPLVVSLKEQAVSPRKQRASPKKQTVSSRKQKGTETMQQNNVSLKRKQSLSQNDAVEQDSPIGEEDVIPSPPQKSPRKKRMKTGEECLLEESPWKRSKLETLESEQRRIEELSNWLWSPEKSSEDSPESMISKELHTPESISKSAKKGILLTTTPLTSTPKVLKMFTPPTSPSSAGSTTPGGKKITRLRSQKTTASRQRSPIVRKASPPSRKRKQKSKDGLEQMVLDLGQKYFGAVTCETCGMVYTAAHPEDEANHAAFHRKYLNFIKFNGWKNETVLDVFEDGRIIVVTSDAPKYCIKKIEEVQELVDQELGFLEGNNLAGKTHCKTLLFINNEKKVAGCLIAEGISHGYRVIPDDDNSEKPVDSSQESQKAWCCEVDKVPAVCGVSRIWVAGSCRRNKVATRLMDALKNNFIYGTVLNKDNIAFSDPTPDGKMFATSYTKSKQFLVYKYK